MILKLIDIDINKLVVSNKISFGKKSFKYFISWKDADKIKPLCIFLPKTVHIEETLIKLNIYIFW